MAKQAKPKPKTGTRNESRKNGKAFKKGNMKHTGMGVSPIMNAIMGKGVYVNINKTTK